MTGVRFADVQSRPAEFLNLTSLTLEEFQVLVALFEAAFQEHMAAWRLDGKPRTARRFTVYRTCPLATPEERLFFVCAKRSWRDPTGESTVQERRSATGRECSGVEGDDHSEAYTAI